MKRPLAPLIFFGCVYYPWSVLNSFPLLQKVVLINPLVYAARGCAERWSRSILKQFYPKAIS